MCWKVTVFLISFLAIFVEGYANQDSDTTKEERSYNAWDNIDTTETGYTITRTSISKREFKKRQKEAYKYNYKSHYTNLDSITDMRILGDTAIIKNCSYTSEMLDARPWSQDSTDFTERMGIDEFENGRCFLSLSFPIWQISYLITDNTPNYKLCPYEMQSDFTAYNKNGLYAGTEGEDSEEGTRIHIYKVEDKEVKQVTYFDNYDSSIEQMFWYGDDCLYVESTLYEYKEDEIGIKQTSKLIYYKLTFKK